ncbi:MAG: hypothetical protein OXN84_01125 [Albidovulum sp.]|nr:hypothetical protein [Albidovulum sp.]
MAFETNERRQRLKRTGRWPKWLRAPFLLKWAFRIGMFVYRLWRLWISLSGGADS